MLVTLKVKGSGMHTRERGVIGVYVMIVVYSGTCI